MHLTSFTACQQIQVFNSFSVNTYGTSAFSLTDQSCLTRTYERGRGKRWEEDREEERERHGEERKTRKLNRNQKREKKQEGGRKKLK